MDCVWVSIPALYNIYTPQSPLQPGVLHVLEVRGRMSLENTKDWGASMTRDSVHVCAGHRSRPLGKHFHNVGNLHTVSLVECMIGCAVA